MTFLWLLIFQCTFTVTDNRLTTSCTTDQFRKALAQDFHLQPTSPAIGKGLCLPEVTTDFDGVPRPNRAPGARFPEDSGCEIGAFQFAVSGVPPAPTNLRIISK